MADQCHASSPSVSTPTSAMAARKIASLPLSDDGAPTRPLLRTQPAAKVSAKPSTAATISQRSAQAGASKAGRAMEAACTSSQAATA
ncbi:MAG: hypothetical protein WDN03_03670 [Rhizomicrobium sp.]